MYKLIAIAFLIVSTAAAAQVVEENYPEDPASLIHDGVPKGEVLHFTFNHSRIFPGTSRDYWIYVPAQYRPEKPACVYVNQDGIQWKAPVVFDNLINSNEMPVTIGVFITPGVVKAVDTSAALNRYNRSFEYDGLGDAYVRFVLEEILPEVEQRKTTDGRNIRLSKSGNDRAIGGSSSGAVCAFTAAWERPREFSRVFSAVGTYVGLRGADRYPTLVRKYEPKGIRVFLQDGSNDLNIYAGDWWKANETMERALIFSGYEVQHQWGQGQHNGKHGTAVFPDAMRWLWKDWPQPVQQGISKNQFLSDLLVPNNTWEPVVGSYSTTKGAASNASGDFFFDDQRNAKTFTISTNGVPVASANRNRNTGGTAFGHDGKRLVILAATRQLVSYNAAGRSQVVTGDLDANDLTVAFNGNIYATSNNQKGSGGRLFLIRPNGKKVEVDSNLYHPTGVTLSPDQTQLYVTDSYSHWLWVYQVQADGTLAYKQRYGWLHQPDEEGYPLAQGLQCDRDGRIYIATRAGIQVMDQTGRVNAILPVPSGNPSDLCFGGPDFDTLFVLAGDKVYRRKLKVHGANTFEKPLKPAAPKL